MGRRCVRRSLVGISVALHFAPGVDWDEFCVVRASDIPGENVIVHLFKDHPCLADGYVNHPDEPILLLAHPEKAALLHAMKNIHIDYEELPGVFTLEESETAVEAFEQSGDDSHIIWPTPKAELYGASQLLQDLRDVLGRRRGDGSWPCGCFRGR